jgi:hypothetical protein
MAPARVPAEAVDTTAPMPKGTLAMTATAVHASSAAPALAGKTAASVFVAFSAMLIALAVAPLAVLAVAVAVLVILGMAEVGRSVDRTFQSLVALGTDR